MGRWGATCEECHKVCEEVFWLHSEWICTRGLGCTSSMAVGCTTEGKTLLSLGQSDSSADRTSRYHNKLDVEINKDIKDAIMYLATCYESLPECPLGSSNFFLSKTDLVGALLFLTDLHQDRWGNWAHRYDKGDFWSSVV